MTVAFSLLASATVLAALQLFLIPIQEKRCRSDRQLSVVKHTSRLAVMYVLRSVFGLATLAFTLLLLAAIGLRWLGGENALALRETIPLLEELHSILGRVKPLWCAAALLAITPVLCFIAYRTTRRRMTHFFEHALRRDLERLRNERDTGAWTELAPTDEMRQIDSALAETLRVLQRIESIDMPAEARAAQLSRLEAKSASLLEQRQKLDVRRRVTVQVDLDDVMGGGGRGVFRRMFHALIGDGPAAQLPGTSRYLFVGALLALAPVWLGVEVESLRGAIDKRIVQIHARLAATGEREALHRLDPTGSDEPLDWEDTDEDLADELAREFEQGIGRLLLPLEEPALRRMAAREAILARYVREGGAAGVTLVPAMHEAPALPADEREALELLKKTENKLGPRTMLGRKFKGELKKSAQRSKKLWRRFRSAIEDGDQAFSEPLVATEIGPFSAAAALSGALHGDELPAGIREVAQQLRSEPGSEALTRAFDLKAAQFKTMLVEHGSISRAASAVASPSGVWRGEEIAPLTRALQQLPRAERLGALTADHPPALRLGPDPGVHLDRAAARIDALRRKLGRSHSPRAIDRLTDALAAYDDWFPAQRGSNLRSQRGLVLAQFGSSAEDDPFPSSRSANRLADAPRVSGLVLGQSAPTELDLQKLHFKVEGKRISLVVERADGRAIWIGAYPKRTIWQALAFAADGRPVALTKSAAAPLAGRRVLIHPALVDTPLGCRLLSVYETLEEYALRAHAGAIETAKAHHALYQVAWAVRATTLIRASELRLKDPRGEPPPWLRETAVGILATPSVLAGAQRALDAPGLLKESQRSPLPNNREQYDPELIEYIQGCAMAVNGSLPSFEECVARSARRWFDSRPSGDRSDWISPPPDVSVAVIATDKPFKVDAEVSFLQPLPPEVGDLLGGFNLDLQLAYSSPARGEAERPGSTPRTWRIAELHPESDPDVRRSLEEDRNLRRMLTELGELTALQRFFRAAFEGRLGPSFPLERIVELAQLTTPTSRATVETPRWESKPGVLEQELGAMLRAAIEQLSRDPSVPRTITVGFNRCVDLVERERGLDRWSQLSDDTWEQSCDFSAIEKGAPAFGNADSAQLLLAVMHRAGEVAEARRLRRMLQVDAGAPSAASRECPKI